MFFTINSSLNFYNWFIFNLLISRLKTSRLQYINIYKFKNLTNYCYDITTLYFEASVKTGFSKDGKHSNPQIFLGLLVGLEGNRIEAHICISFTAYAIYKELERILYKEKSDLSLEKAKELTHNMYEITYTLPESKQTKSKLLKMDDKQSELFQIIFENF